MSERQLSVATSFDYNVPIEAQIPLIKSAGFTHVSLGARESHSQYGSEEGRRRLKGLLDEYSLELDTIHGPGVDQPNSAERLAVAAEAASSLLAPVVVMHGGPFSFGESELPVRLERLLQIGEILDSVSVRTGVIFALENVAPGPATDLVRLALPHLNPQRFGFCYDSSHDQIDGPRPFDLLMELKDRVQAVHLSDRIREFVDHVIPGEGFIDWATLASVLRSSSFTGPMLFEVITTHSQEKDPERFLELAYKRGCWIYDSVFGERPTS